MILGSAVAALLVVSIGFGTVSTAGNSVPISVASLSNHAVRPAQVAPTQCSGLPLEKMLLGGRTIRGKGSNDLLIADGQSLIVSGRKGSDCLIAAADYAGVLNGGKDSDVCIGGVNTVFENCEVQVGQ